MSAEHDHHGHAHADHGHVHDVSQHDPEAAERRYEYYDPIHTLPETGRSWWDQQEPGVRMTAGLASA